MSERRWTETTLDILKDFLTEKIEGYLQEIRNETTEELPAFSSIMIGQDYTKRGKVKPFILIDPALNDIDEEGQGVISAAYQIDVLVVVDGYDDEIVSRRCMRYADAIQFCLLDDDTLDGEVYHCRVNSVEYFPGGSGNEKYALLSLTVMREVPRR